MKNFNKILKSITFALVFLFANILLAPNSAQAGWETRAEMKKDCKTHMKNIRGNNEAEKYAMCEYERTGLIGRYPQLTPILEKVGYAYRMLLKAVFIFIFVFTVFKIFKMHEAALDWAQFKNIGIGVIVLSIATIAMEYIAGDELGFVFLRTEHNRKYADCRKPRLIYKRCSSADVNASFINKKYLLSTEGIALVNYNIDGLKNSRKDDIQKQTKTLF